MNKENARLQLKENLKNYVEQITKKSKGNKYICPLCGSGTGKNGTGAFSISDDEKTWKCFSCNEGGDIFDLIGKYEGITDYNEQLKKAEEIFGMTDHSHQQPTAKKEQSSKKENQKDEQDFKDFFLEAHKNINNTDYWKKRGLSKAIVENYNIGYVEQWRSPNVPPTVPTTPRLIIPTSDTSYLARDTREIIPQGQENFSKMKVGSTHFFNIKALWNTTKPVFIVEGEFDALSLIEVEAEAVALGSISNIRNFIELIKNHKPTSPLILYLDNDKAGKEATKKLGNELKQLNIYYQVFFQNWEYKDASEALQHDKNAFYNVIDSFKTGLRASYLRENAVAYKIREFMDGIANSVNTPYVPTGFKQLDSTLDGGLYEGLYIVGAISSLGKTTLLIQIADQIAQSGKDVLIFSLEMARNEIISKSISRHTLLNVIANGGDVRNAKTARGITTGTRYKDYNSAEIELIKDSIQSYSEYAKHLFITEGIGNIGAEEIRTTIENHISFTGNTPVVIIDYLQILSPYNVRLTDKQNTDKSVIELKRISRDFKTPVIGISSFNRANYSSAVTMEAFKESGAIEYSSDVLIGLQLEGAGEKGFDATQAKTQNPREVELVVLKNRNGKTGSKLNFSYYPLFNYFKEQ